MATGRSVAVVGATGAVGEELLTVLEQRSFPVRGLRALASPRSAGRRVRFAGEELPVEPLGPRSFEGVELAFFSAGAAVSREHAPRAMAQGAIVIDNSSAFRLDPEVPLVVPECNPHALGGHRGLIANPNCSTILMALVLAPLQRAAGLRRVIVATYQAASGAGRRAIEELRAGVASVCAGGDPPPAVSLPAPLAFNVFPHVDRFEADGYTREEDKMLHETRKILEAPDLRVEATCVRVPVERCHSEAITMELAQPLSVARAREILATAPGLVLRDDAERSLYPQPLEMTGRDEVAVGRIRASRVFASGLTLWAVGDQLRKGAALNAVQIAETV